MKNYSISEIYDELISKLTRELNDAYQQNKIVEFIKKYNLFENEEVEAGYYCTNKSKILIVGELSFSADVLYSIVKSYGVNKDRIKYLNYKEAKNFNFQMLKGYSNYSDIIIGPNSHKVRGINGYNSLIEMIKNEQKYFPKLTEVKDSTGKLKITKTGLKKALEKTNIYQLFKKSMIL